MWPIVRQDPPNLTMTSWGFFGFFAGQLKFLSITYLPMRLVVYNLFVVMNKVDVR
jgi:hypothetical protein